METRTPGGGAIVTCVRCIYDDRVPGIRFDGEGVCNYCRQVEDLTAQYGTGLPKGKAEWDRIVAEIKRAGRGKKYDCVVGVSGGTDSSYMVYLAKEFGLRPLAVHYDDTWNSAIASENIRKVLADTGVDLFTYVINNKESDDIFRAFFLAGVPEMGTPTDLALAEVLYRAAARNGVKYVLEGHSFLAEGVSPIGKNYFDGKYIESIHKRFGRLPMKSYPLMTFLRFMRWIMLGRIKKIRPYWYLQYSKEEAQEFLKAKCGWKYYGGHHLENRLVSFSIGLYLPRKFGLDYRNLTLSARARAGLVDRGEAMAEYARPPKVEDELLPYFKKRLGLSDEDYERVMRAEPKFWWEFPTYKKRFERLRPIFAVLAKANLVPMSFYLKYCFPVKV
ncbi:MAG: N-acetyl sugar amidotransferase [Verrucomicrobia bacterium]|nr:N-acetyl sugar amidotransferase [Verrucomicrobiota bacterium]